MGKASYRKKDNTFVPISGDGTSMEGYTCKEDGVMGLKGTTYRPVALGPSDFWAYAVVYCVTSDAFMWEMVRNIALGNDYGDIGARPADKPQLASDIITSDPYALLGFLELYDKTGKKIFLDVAKRIGDNILVNRFHKGFFVASDRHIYAKLDAIDTLVLLHLYSTVTGNSMQLPQVWPSRPFFSPRFRYRREGIDNWIIYTLTDSHEPPLSLPEAAAIGDATKVKSMISRGVSVDIRDDTMLETALHRAVLNSKRGIVQLLLEEGASPNAKGGNYGISPLFYAAEVGHKDIVELLLKKGADINARNDFGDTPLQYAAFADNKDIVELLLQKGATIANIHIASYMGDLEKAKGFINEGVDINATDGHGYAPLHYAVQNNQKQAVELLLQKGANVNVTRWNRSGGKTPLDIAVDRGYKDIAVLLINNGAKASIHTAAWAGDLARVKECLEEGVDVNTKGPRGQTALHIAASGGYKQIVELVLDNGADINAGMNLNRTAAEVAMYSGHSDIVELLISKGADVSPLHLAISIKDETNARSLIASGVDVNKRTQYGTTPLHTAAHVGLKDIAQLLIEKGADINAQENWDWTPLNLAINSGNLDIVELLVTKGANVNTESGSGRYPLSYAKGRGLTEIAELLRKHGAKE